jgi:hypothetical protein
MPGRVHAYKRLTDISVRFPAEFVSIRSRFFPRKSVEHLSDLIVRWNKTNILRQCRPRARLRRGPGEHVFIDERELKNPATMRALYTLEQAYALERARLIKKETRSQMRQLVEQMQESVAEELRDLKERAARAFDAASKG